MDGDEIILKGIPTVISDWTIDVLNNLVKTRKIETDDFDFKSDYKEMSKHLCAFANYSFGQMVLGIKTVKNNVGRIVKIEKKGFSESKSDSIRNELNNAISNVEPAPSVQLNYIPENGKVFLVVQIKGEDFKKPYVQKGTGICYIRIGASTTPASRTNIIHLFSDIRAKIEKVEKLAISADFLKEMIMYTSEGLDEEDPKNKFGRITPLNWDLFKNCALDTEWFLKEINLYGGHIKANSVHGGLHSFLYDMELFNLDINIYNSETFTENRIKIKNKIDDSWKEGKFRYNECLGFLDELISQAKKFVGEKMN